MNETTFLIFTSFVFGAIFGSFANVIIYRMPKGESIVLPRSRCPSCGKTISWYDNLPIISWILLRGRCRSCATKISARYPLVELIMGTLFAAIVWRFGLSWTTLEYIVFAFGLVTVSFIDIDHMILPDEFTLTGLVVGLLGAALNPEREFVPALIGALTGGGILWLVGVSYQIVKKREGMGGGDVKLLAWIGAVLGWTSVPFVILSSSLVGSVVGIFILIRRRSDLTTAIPFGPYLVLGAVAFMFFGEDFISWYMQRLSPAIGPVH